MAVDPNSAKPQVPQAVIPGCVGLEPSHFLVCEGNAPAAQGGRGDKGRQAMWLVIIPPGPRLPFLNGPGTPTIAVNY